MRRRTHSREIAVQFLYQLDLRGDEVMADLSAFLAEQGKDDDVRTFAQRLITGTMASRDAIDARLKTVTKNWDLRRMAAVDRNILRLAIYELMHCPDVPPKVAINEAIEIGKKFSTANSGGFVNGILDRVRMDLEQERPAPAVEGAQGG